MAHSLQPAIDAGIITEEKAFCGLSASHVRDLAALMPRARLLVRFRGPKGDGRLVVSAFYLHNAKGSIQGTPFTVADIRDVTAVAE